jgi:muramoyltetrapeptide carboxypeptidase
MHTEFHRALRPPAVQKGRAIGVAALASPAEAALLEAGCRSLASLGWPAIVAGVGMQPEAHFAGPAEARAATLMELWQRKDCGAIVCARGGYGSNYLLPLLDFEAMRAAPKAFVGYSDNTSLLLALDRAGIVCFHGPMVASDFAAGRADRESFVAALTGQPREHYFGAGSGVTSLVPGEARGQITGGCLSVVVTTLGTPWEIETRNRILFLEDVNEKPFRIDRMLMHLKLAGKFDSVRGFIFGAMKGCEAADGEEPLMETILRILDPLGVPILFGFPSGHVDGGNITLPFGVQAQIAVSSSQVAYRVEAATLV